MKDKIEDSNFHSSQGRIDSSFMDDNETLLAELHTKFPTLTSLEMETAHLYHLARISSPAKGVISAAACHMIFASRSGPSHASSAEQGNGSPTFIDPDLVKELEKGAGKACLEAVCAFTIQKERLHSDRGSVWEV
ncbi:hypothetical protein P7C70_g2770, partial [Phenoliferia sp. Uapishka_3]